MLSCGCLLKDESLPVQVNLVLVQLADQWALLKGLHHQVHATWFVHILIAQMMHKLTCTISQLYHEARADELWRESSGLTSQLETHSPFPFSV